MKRLIIIALIFSGYIFAQDFSAQDNEKIQIGIYALQSHPGTSGHQNGSLKDIEDDIKAVLGTVNAAIPYRHWDRVNYPDWDYFGYFTTYFNDMYSFTFSMEDLSCVQVFTPPLYSSFLDPPVAKMPDDDRWYNRNLDFDLFQNFIKLILNKELNLVSKMVNGDSEKIIKILSNTKLRPLGGWYLDDEPLVRNHDIEVIETMSEIIRLLEKEFFHEKIVPLGINEDQLEKYLHPRYIAFDGDDLHKYPRSGRSFDGKFCNRDGNTIYFKNHQIYTVFKENTFDVLLLDFYHNNIPFWKKMFKDIDNEFTESAQKTPVLMPVINTQVSKTSKLETKINEIDEQLKLFSDYNLKGIWMYIWDDFDSNNLDANKLWNKTDFNLRNLIKSIKKN